MDDTQTNEVPGTVTLKLWWDDKAKVFVGKCMERSIYSQGTTREEAALATLSAVKLIDENGARKA